MIARRCLAACVWILAAAVGAAASDPSLRARLAALEPAVTREPENLQLAAEYRQAAIAAGEFDRSIRLMERLADAKNAGPNVQISLALAYVDKVPTSGDMRRLYLARDAIGALTRAIDRQPTVLAYYVRGVINLYFNNLIFHRIPRGIEDLRKANELVTASTPAGLAGAVWASIGDGYWRLGDRAKARAEWRLGGEKYPGDEKLRARLSADDSAVDAVVFEALYAGHRVDTSLRGALP